MKILLTIVCGALLGSSPVFADGLHVLPLSGSDWQIASFEPGQGEKDRAYADGYPAAEAIAATVPGDVHWDLERVGRIPPIYYGTNSQKIVWVAAKEWWYRKSFVTPAAWENKKLTLQFDGVDYLADVWLNGKYVGRHEGQFTPFEFDVSGLLRKDGTNILAVLIHAAPAAVVAANDNGGKADVYSTYYQSHAAMHNSYPYWKSMTNANWDWGAAIITMGIWKDVRLVATEGVSLANSIVLPQLAPPYDVATLNTRLNIQSDKAQAVELTYRVRCLTADDPPTIAVHKEELAAGAGTVEFSMQILKPQLWWPNGLGQQHLYELEVTARAAGAGNVLAVVHSTFGIRDLQMLQNPEDTDNKEYKLPQPPPERKYLIQINGRKVFARGGNWIPCDLLYGRPGRSFYEHLIRSAAECNYNLFRVWGGGLIEKPEFYDLCDKYGIMLFQEFPNAAGLPAENDAALAIMKRETVEVLPLLMNHPCVVRYGGGNELNLDAKNSRQMAQLRAVCNELDPTRPYHDPDPESIAQRHGPYWYSQATYAAFNTRRGTINDPEDPTEWTEYGVPGASSVETLKSIMPAAALWPINPGNPYWVWHKAFGVFMRDDWLDASTYTELFGELPDLETTVRCSQFVQAEGLRYEDQSMRRFRWHRSACTTWTFDEPWPNAAQGCLIEYSGRPKMAYYYTKQAFAPIDVLAVYNNLEWESGSPVAVDLWVTYDGLTELRNCQCRYRIFNVHGDLLAEKSQACSLAPESSAKMTEVAWTPPASMKGQAALLWVELLDGAGQPMARNLYTFGVTAEIEPWFQIDLGKTATIGRFKLGRDRTGVYHERGADYLKIETSLDGRRWQTVFEKAGITSRPGFDSAKTLAIDIAPVPMRYVKVTVAPVPGSGALPCIDEFEAYAPEKDEPVGLPQMTIEDKPGDLPNGSNNLAFVGNGAKPATASSARPEPNHQPSGINDGKYGNDHSWIGTPTNAPPLAGLLNAPPTVLHAGIGPWHRQPNGDIQAEIEVRNETAIPALFVKLDVQEPPGQVYLSDNYFFLPPEETRRVWVTLSKAEGEEQLATLPHITVSVWNSNRSESGE